MIALYTKAAISLLIVVFMIIIISVLLYRHRFDRKSSNVKEKKLKLEDVLMVDHKNKLVLIKCNNAFYLLLIGNNTSTIMPCPTEDPHNKSCICNTTSVF